ncbi:hypothetical protein ICW40_10595 [Actinotalea ferrariae]|uniref:hypothetical protein n=1 Tax=Actinotalea ferrariae TaxID=1386098 RepID=UPI001C8BCB52|nr:hypothetical protein [Actinotalea ferrariae]MBX9245253.1 hypothetical protein [Actinotalea ferrariae]
MARKERPARPGDLLLTEVSEHLRGSPAVEEGLMLHSPGLKVGGTFFAFVGGDDDLIVKLPRARADAAVADGSAHPVTLGTRTMKEWVSVPFPGRSGDGREAWRAAVDEAHAYVASLSADPAAPRTAASRDLSAR